MKKREKQYNLVNTQMGEKRVTTNTIDLTHLNKKATVANDSINATEQGNGMDWLAMYVQYEEEVLLGIRLLTHILLLLLHKKAPRPFILLTPPVDSQWIDQCNRLSWCIKWRILERVMLTKSPSFIRSVTNLSDAFSTTTSVLKELCLMQNWIDELKTTAIRN